ncbi:MAG: VaFE repeat-containing surface-anchored protein [Eubacterium sp.]|nr:VaFE repeat-containing surface-anchored protein [Eubacterium sp.]
MKKKISKIMAVLLSMLILLTQTVPAFAALTEGNKYDFETRYLDAYYDTGTWETADGHIHNNYGQVALRNLKSTGEPIYCIQIYNAVNSDAATAEELKDTGVWRDELTGVAQNGITKVSVYGYPNYTYGYSADDAQLATQVLMWDFEIDRRSDFSVATTAFARKIFANYPDAEKCYLEILKACSGHYIRPDFDTNKVTLKGTGSSNAVNVYDANFVLSNYTVSSSDSRIKTEILGNRLTVYAEGSGTISGRLTLTKKNTDINSVFALTGANQTLLYGTIEDPVRTVLTVEMISLGNLSIHKTSEDNNVSGISFTIKGNGYSKTVTTDNNGNIRLNDLQPGTYTVTENSSDKYAAQKAQTVTVESGKTTSVTFNNVLKKFRVTVTKADAENGTAQGDATLAGAVYGIYNNGALVDTYTTDAEGKFTTKYYVCGNNWTIREITPSTGYLLDETEYKIGAEAKNYTVELNDTTNTVKEQVIKGNVAIIKHIGNGSAGVETPESGAEFQLYLKSAGNYENAKQNERDTLVCDENGYAVSKDLPYGVYTLHQSKGWDGTEYVTDFDVYISENGKTHHYIMNNPLFNSHLKIVKTDAETGKAIAYAGAGFQIYKPDGTLVTQSFTYPTPSTIDTFYTNADGELITPEVLEYGKGYKLVEVQAPYGYVLDSAPTVFDVTEENSTSENALTIVKVNKSNLAQKGVIEITKIGEIFSSVGMLGGGYVDENGNDVSFPITYSPIFDTKNLADAVFQIFAAEDIITLDGTVRAAKGDLVDEITTDEKGSAKSKELYLGKYTVIEKSAPDTFVISNEKYDIELAYADQKIEITTADLSVFNERQKVAVSLNKLLENNETFDIGNNNEILSVQFGLYADEDVTAADGSIIPQDSLITFSNCDENGNITFNCDLPIGFKWYVKEIATDEHYILSDTKYEFDTDYQGQDTEIINIEINNSEPIENKLIYGNIKGLKIDRETKKAIEGALFGLFNTSEIEFTEDNAIFTAVSDKNGIFKFENIPFGNWIVKELKPAAGYLQNTELHYVQINSNEQNIELTIENDHTPEIRTTATIDGEKETASEGEITIIDTVSYKHLVPGKEYVLKGVLMDKSTGKPFEVNGVSITSEVTFVPETANGTVDVELKFDSSSIKRTTELVVFETLYQDNIELTAHADINDEGQTVTITRPELKSPNTGADANVPRILFVFAIVAAAITSTYFLTIRNRKSEEKN